MKSRSVDLCGGTPRYDETVMDFERWGMCGAAPRFRSGGLMSHCSDFGLPDPQRDHHAAWFKLIDHPDARLIAAAPMLLEAAEPIASLKQFVISTLIAGQVPNWQKVDAEFNALLSAIAAAKGGRG